MNRIYLACREFHIDAEVPMVVFLVNNGDFFYCFLDSGHYWMGTRDYMSCDSCNVDYHGNVSIPDEQERSKIYSQMRRSISEVCSSEKAPILVGKRGIMDKFITTYLRLVNAKDRSSSVPILSSRQVLGYLTMIYHGVFIDGGGLYGGAIVYTFANCFKNVSMKTRIEAMNGKTSKYDGLLESMYCSVEDFGEQDQQNDTEDNPIIHFGCHVGICCPLHKDTVILRFLNVDLDAGCETRTIIMTNNTYFVNEVIGSFETIKLSDMSKPIEFYKILNARIKHYLYGNCGIDGSNPDEPSEIEMEEISKRLAETRRLLESKTPLSLASVQTFSPQVEIIQEKILECYTCKDRIEGKRGNTVCYGKCSLNYHPSCLTGELSCCSRCAMDLKYARVYHNRKDYDELVIIRRVNLDKTENVECDAECDVDKMMECDAECDVNKVMEPVERKTSTLSGWKDMDDRYDLLDIQAKINKAEKLHKLSTRRIIKKEKDVKKAQRFLKLDGESIRVEMSTPSSSSTKKKNVAKLITKETPTISYLALSDTAVQVASYIEPEDPLFPKPSHGLGLKASSPEFIPSSLI